MYQYKAKVIRIVDGDTLHLEVELGFDVTRKDSFRLYGIDAPELNTDAGKAAKVWLAEALTQGVLIITTHKDDREKYGRYLATLWIDQKNVNEAMVAAGHAVAYSGGKR
jgi:endonuclease YncB( thermonuclease family)